MRKPYRRGYRRIRNRNDHIPNFMGRLICDLVCQFFPQPLPHMMDVEPVPRLIRARKINMLEDTHRRRLRGWQRLHHLQGTIGKGYHLARLDITDCLTSQGLQGPRLGCDRMPSAWQQPYGQRTKSPGITHSVNTIARQDHQGIRAHPFLHGGLDAFLPGRAAVARQHHGHHLGIG